MIFTELYVLSFQKYTLYISFAYLEINTSNIRSTSSMGSTPVRSKSSFLRARTVDSLLSTSWFQERIRELIALYIIEQK